MKELPPIIPSDPEKLQRAIKALGNRAQNVAASKKQRKLLVELLGVCPESIEQAMRFKQALKKLAKWEAEDQAAATGAAGAGTGDAGEEETEEALARDQDAEAQVAASFSPKAMRAIENRVKLLARLQAEQE